jgi:hypothetical protein
MRVRTPATAILDGAQRARLYLDRHGDVVLVVGSYVPRGAREIALHEVPANAAAFRFFAEGGTATLARSAFYERARRLLRG